MDKKISKWRIIVCFIVLVVLFSGGFAANTIRGRQLNAEHDARMASMAFRYVNRITISSGAEVIEIGERTHDNFETLKEMLNPFSTFFGYTFIQGRVRRRTLLEEVMTIRYYVDDSELFDEPELFSIYIFVLPEGFDMLNTNAQMGIFEFGENFAIAFINDRRGNFMGQFNNHTLDIDEVLRLAHTGQE